MQVSSSTWYARAEAYEECAGHLELDWTVDVEERAEGAKLVVKFRVEAARCNERGDAAFANESRW